MVDELAITRGVPPLGGFLFSTEPARRGFPFSACRVELDADLLRPQRARDAVGYVPAQMKAAFVLLDLRKADNRGKAEVLQLDLTDLVRVGVTTTCISSMK